MEGNIFQNITKFKNPEEELAFLRSQVEKREKELQALGHFENARNNAISETISDYKLLPKY